MAFPGIFHEEKGSPSLPKSVFLHGLLGSSRNWRSVCKSLSEESHSFALDLPNHGQSFHSEDSTIKGMARDILRWLDEMGLDSVFLCGHSLGGKVAMRFASDYPERVEKLIVVDMAPAIIRPNIMRLPWMRCSALIWPSLVRKRGRRCSFEDPSELGFPSVFADQPRAGRAQAFRGSPT